MAVFEKHAWDLSPEEAKALQDKYAPLVDDTDAFDEIRYVAGVDVAYIKEHRRAIAGVIVLDYKTLEPVEQAHAVSETTMPYHPGLFSFLEMPAVLKAIEKLEHQPDLFVLDGQGRAHPRRFGLACHLGLYLNKPTIGCAKSRLIGVFDDPGTARGEWSLLMDKEENVGRVLRTQNGVRPLFISVGHQCSLHTATEIILNLAQDYRQPETTRLADQLVGEKKREWLRLHPG